MECLARKYVAFNEDEAHIFHIGDHICQPRPLRADDSDIVSNALSNDPYYKSSGIQSSRILSAMRERKSWNTLKQIVADVTNRCDISNEMIRKGKEMEPYGKEFEAVNESKSFTDETDIWLIYDVNENKDYVFKTSNTKMSMTNKMQNEEHLLKDEYCCFDGKHGRVRNYVTLTASLYHPVLQKQVALASTECKHEDSINAELFWRVFNDAYKLCNGHGENVCHVVG